MVILRHAGQIRQRQPRNWSWRASKGINEMAADAWRWRSRNPDGYAASSDDETNHSFSWFYDQRGNGATWFLLRMLVVGRSNDKKRIYKISSFP